MGSLQVSFLFERRSSRPRGTRAPALTLPSCQQLLARSLGWETSLVLCPNLRREATALGQVSIHFFAVCEIEAQHAKDVREAQRIVAPRNLFRAHARFVHPNDGVQWHAGLANIEGSIRIQPKRRRCGS